MAKVLTQEFVDRKISRLVDIPRNWDVDRGQYYKLDLKMCQLVRMVYGFDWGTERSPALKTRTVIEVPSRILKLDLSLNELSALEHEGLAPFRNLQALDASLNRITSVVGIELLKYLQSINLSHNHIRRVDNFPTLTSLVDLNLSMNSLNDIVALPSLVNLTILHLNNNKIKSLDGVQSLGRLKELYVQHNELAELIPLSGSLHLTILNASENQIVVLNSVTDVLARLKRLSVLHLQGNPVEQATHYQSELLEKTSIISLDNVSVRPVHRQPEGRQLSENILSIKDLTRHAFEEQIRGTRDRMEDNVKFLQARIISLQDEFKTYEDKMRSDLDLCLRHLDGLSASQLRNFDGTYLRGSIGTPDPKPWHQQGSPYDFESPRHQKKEGKADYKDIKDTDEILRLAYVELSKDQDTLDQV